MKRSFLPFASLLFVAALLCPDAEAQNKPSRTPPSLPPPTNNVYQVLNSHKDLSEFTAMVDKADLKSLLTGSPDQPVTVLAPNNEAMDKLSSDESKKIKASTASLQSFVKYHVITGSLMSSSAIKGRKSSPAADNGEILVLDGSDRKNPPKIGDGILVQGDINATNGVIHVVSSPLVPPSLGGGAGMQAMKPPTPPPPVPPTVAAAPTKPTTPSVKAAATPAAAVTTAGTPESSPPTGETTGTPMEQTATGIPSSQTTTGSVPEVTPEQPAQQPVPAPATGGDSSSGASIWKKMGW